MQNKPEKTNSDSSEEFSRVYVLGNCVRLPEISCELLNISSPALLDTASQISIISSDVYNRLEDRPELQPWKSTIIGASGNQLTALGRIELPLKIGNWCKNTTFAVVRGFPYKVLLGINILAHSDIRLGKHTFRPYLGQKVPLRSPDNPTGTPVFQVQPGTDTVIPPRRIAMVTV